MDHSEKDKTITFEYKISSNYCIYSIGGIHGGINVHGEIIANVFSERMAIPRKMVHVIDKNGRLGEIVEQEKKDSIIRDVLFGLSINPSIARSIAKWLNERVDEYEKMICGQAKGELLNASDDKCPIRH